MQADRLIPNLCVWVQFYSFVARGVVIQARNLPRLDGIGADVHIEVMGVRWTPVWRLLPRNPNDENETDRPLVEDGPEHD